MTMTTVPTYIGQRKQPRQPRLRSGFTITELLIAVVLLIIIMLVAYRIFSTSSQVVRIGEGMAGINQELAAVERLIREDFSRLSQDGFFAIRCVAVPNDIRGEPLLDPALPPSEVVRCDQMVFFTTGFDAIQTWPRGSTFAEFQHRKPRSAVARVYYGHGFQIRGLNPPLYAAADSGAQVLPGVEPWFGGSTNLMNAAGDAVASFVAPVPATEWTLARQSILMIDDGGNQDVAFFDFDTSLVMYSDSSAFNGAIVNSIRDVTAQQMNGVRQDIRFNSGGTWAEQRNRILGAYLFYPRSERTSPTVAPGSAGMTLREAQATTLPTLSVACSSFIIEWTYENETGQVTNADGTTYQGVVVDPQWPQPWFGLPDYAFAGDGTVSQTPRQVMMLGDGVDMVPGEFPFRLPLPPAATILPDVIEQANLLTWNGRPMAVYEAVFGFNPDAPLVHPDTGQPDAYVGVPPATVADALDVAGFTPYTPWPSAVRITMTLHDRLGRIEDGREIQFVIELPKR